MYRSPFECVSFAEDSNKIDSMSDSDSNVSTADTVLINNSEKYDLEADIPNINYTSAWGLLIAMKKELLYGQKFRGRGTIYSWTLFNM